MVCNVLSVCAGLQPTRGTHSNSIAGTRALCTSVALLCDVLCRCDTVAVSSSAQGKVVARFAVQCCAEAAHVLCVAVAPSCVRCSKHKAAFSTFGETENQRAHTVEMSCCVSLHACADVC